MIRTIRRGASLAAIVALALVTVAAAEDADTPPRPSAAASPASAPVGKGALATTKRPLTALPYTPSLDVTAMDRAIDPCVDFFKYSCGGWNKKNPIPADQARWDVYGKLTDDSAQYLWGLLEEAAKPAPGRDAATQKIGDYFASCMDEPAIEKAGAAPLESDLAAIDALAAKDALASLIGRLHLGMDTSGMLFGFGSEQDFKNASQVIGFATAGGLGLPDRDYYTKDDAKSQETRKRYVEHVAKILRLLGEPEAAAKKDADTVMRIETGLARASLTRVDRRDPYKIYHRMHRAEMQALTPSFRWDDYLRAIGQPALDDVNVTEPEFYKQVEKTLAGESLGDLKTYLRWQLAHNRARYLSSPFVNESFDFFSAYLRGVKEQQPRWKRCVSWVDRDLGEALGQVFVRKAFPPDRKASTVEMVRQIEAAMEQRIKDLPWMGAATKEQALAKLHGMANKIGYPDTWRDYTALEVRRGDFVGDVDRAVRFESRRQLDKIGKPVDKGEWGMTPPTVNAYNRSSMNEIVFPAGIMQPPFYDPKADDAVNYGGMGAVIGHEITHGFDDQGSKFDAHGNLKDWWTPEDAKNFTERASCVSDQFDGYEVEPGLHQNGKLVLGESIADLGGLTISYAAYEKSLEGKARPVDKDGFSPEQRFFLGWAQVWGANTRAEYARLLTNTNPHPLPRFRGNGPLSNMAEFAKAFGCTKGEAMVREKVCKIW